jgi:hypothetical protein
MPLVAAGQVVPIVGSDLLTMTEGGALVPVYRQVAERLLERYAVDPGAAVTTLRPGHELNDAICVPDRLDKRPAPTATCPCEAIRAVLATAAADRGALSPFGTIDDLRLFVTTTSDDSWRRRWMRFGTGNRRTEQVEYAPTGLPTDRRTDRASSTRRIEPASFTVRQGGGDPGLRGARRRHP